jgi:hypothetical protein
MNGEKLTVGSLFSGIGGIELGLERTGGFETRWFCENDPYASAVLQKHWKEVPNWGDVKRLTFSAEDFHANQSRSLASAKPCRTIDGFGRRSLTPFAKFDLDTSSWRMYLGCLLLTEGEPSEAFSGTWPKSGMTRNGIAYLPRNSELLTFAIESAWLPTPTTMRKGNRSASAGTCYRPSLQEMAEKNYWPTPRARDSTESAYFLDRGIKRPTTVGYARMFPTPVKHDSQSFGPSQLNRHQPGLMGLAHGQLNPTWVEWLMGFPIGWTALDASETPSSRNGRKSSGVASSNMNMTTKNGVEANE